MIITARCLALRAPRIGALSAQRVRALSASAAGAAERQLSVLVPIATGSEEIELSCITDTLVRAGAAVTVASVEASNEVVMSRGLRILADANVADLSADDVWDLVALPGGMPGAERLRDSETLDAILRAQSDRGGRIGAVCASPAVVLAPKGLLGDRATCYPAPAFTAALAEKAAAGDVVVCGAVTTSRGPGTSLRFALSLVESLYGEAKAAELAAQMLVDVE